MADERVGIKVNELPFLSRATRRQLAEALGVSAATASRKVRGEIAWSLSDLYATADFFGVDITELLHRHASSPKHDEPPLPKERGFVYVVAGAGFEPTTSGL
ncbi:helix-turn-helix transcriptional regulator [Corynebacterium sp. CCM 9204]